MKNVILIIIALISKDLNLNAQNFLSKITFVFNQKFIDVPIQILDMNNQSVLLDTLLKDSIFNFEILINEPKELFLYIKDNTVCNSYYFYAENSNQIVHINNYIEFENSPLNHEFYSIFKSRDMLAKLRSKLYLSEKSEQYKNMDSILMNIILNQIKLEEKYYFENRDSYLTLDCIKFIVQNQSFRIPEIKEIFYNLNDNLKFYPSYKYCKAKIDSFGTVLELTQIKSINYKDSDFKIQNDKYTFLNFWSMNCGPCLKEFPILQDLQNNYKDQIQIVCITKDTNQKAIDKYFSVKKYNLKNLTLDPNDINNIQNQMQINFLPFGVLLDKKGSIIKKNLSIKELTEFLQKL